MTQDCLMRCDRGGETEYLFLQMLFVTFTNIKSAFFICKLLVMTHLQISSICTMITSNIGEYFYHTAAHTTTQKKHSTCKTKTNNNFNTSRRKHVNHEWRKTLSKGYQYVMFNKVTVVEINEK